jgi:hypothetical protein
MNYRRIKKKLFLKENVCGFSYHLANLLSVVSNEFVVFWGRKKWIYSVCPPNGRERRTLLFSLVFVMEILLYTK